SRLDCSLHRHMELLIHNSPPTDPPRSTCQSPRRRTLRRNRTALRNFSAVSRTCWHSQIGFLKELFQPKGNVSSGLYKWYFMVGNILCRSKAGLTGEAWDWIPNYRVLIDMCKKIVRQ